MITLVGWRLKPDGDVRVVFKMSRSVDEGIVVDGWNRLVEYLDCAIVRKIDAAVEGFIGLIMFVVWF